MEAVTRKYQTKEVEPPVLYYGTPVVLLTTMNEDGTSNISPISSSWALGRMLVLGLGLGGKAMDNLQRHGECVLNIPDPSLWEHVEKLAPLTGMNPVPEYKLPMFRFEKDKFRAAELTPVPSQVVRPERIAECPLQLEATLKHIRIPETRIAAIVEVECVCVHAHEGITLNDRYIDPERWSPLIYNFRHYFGLGNHLGKTFRALAVDE